MNLALGTAFVPYHLSNLRASVSLIIGHGTVFDKWYIIEIRDALNMRYTLQIDRTLKMAGFYWEDKMVEPFFLRV